MIFQDAAGRAAPVLQGRRPARRGLPGPPPEGLEARRQAAGDRDARPGRHPAAGPAGRRLPAPVLRRHAAARDDRDGPDQRPVAADRRRADHGARRDRAGADPRPAPGPAARVQLRGHHHHPRPRRDRRDGRRRAGDVRRPRGRVRPVQGDPDPPGDALHLGPALQRPGRHRRHRRAADPDPGQPAEPAEPADAAAPSTRGARTVDKVPGDLCATELPELLPGHRGARPPQALPPGRTPTRSTRPRCCRRSRPTWSRRT